MFPTMLQHFDENVTQEDPTALNKVSNIFFILQLCFQSLSKGGVSNFA
jgi:hypothetical protein